MTRLRVAAHVHSEWSYDGRWELGAIARLFGRLGYDAVLMAEHDRGFDDERWGSYREACARASTDDVLLVPGIEYADAADRIHIPVWGDVPFLGEGVETGELLERAVDGGASAVFAHPARRRAAEGFDPDWGRHLLGVEWWNRKYDGYAPNPETGRALASHGTLPFASIDFHTARQLVPLAMIVESDAGRTPRGLFEALRMRRLRPEAFGVPALRFTRGRGLRAARAVEGVRRRVARLVN